MSTPFNEDFKTFFMPIFSKAFENVREDIEKWPDNEVILTFNLFPHRELTLSDKMNFDENVANTVNEIMAELTKDQGLSVLGVVVNKETYKVVVAIKKGELDYGTDQSEEINADSEAANEIH